jgi:hypothetical protein
VAFVNATPPLHVGNIVSIVLKILARTHSWAMTPYGQWQSPTWLDAARRVLGE